MAWETIRANRFVSDSSARGGELQRARGCGEGGRGLREVEGRKFHTSEKHGALAKYEII